MKGQRPSRIRTTSALLFPLLRQVFQSDRCIDPVLNRPSPGTSKILPETRELIAGSTRSFVLEQYCGTYAVIVPRGLTRSFICGGTACQIAIEDLSAITSLPSNFLLIPLERSFTFTTDQIDHRWHRTILLPSPVSQQNSYESGSNQLSYLDVIAGRIRTTISLVWVRGQLRL